MFGLIPRSDAKAVLGSLQKSLAVIEYAPSGEVITANDNFCALLGYRLDEIKGKHHKIFVDADYARSREYEEFSAKLRRGERNTQDYKRLAKNGKEVWIHASYSPVFGRSGEVVKC